MMIGFRFISYRISTGIRELRRLFEHIHSLLTDVVTYSGILAIDCRNSDTGTMGITIVNHIVFCIAGFNRKRCLGDRDFHFRTRYIVVILITSYIVIDIICTILFGCRDILRINNAGSRELDPAATKLTSNTDQLMVIAIISKLICGDLKIDIQLANLDLIRTLIIIVISSRSLIVNSERTRLSKLRHLFSVFTNRGRSV